MSALVTPLVRMPPFEPAEALKMTRIGPRGGRSLTVLARRAVP